ncbi:MAG: response regulator, partial [Proteobacteria bacterium]|nr:response regulator [Pseudomonadota bacterium]
NVKLLVAKLARDYYVVSVASNGLEGLEKAQQDKPDLILLDIMMPELNGFEVCQRLKSDPATAHIPVVMITALTEVTDRVKGLEAGADDFLNKPINDLALMARVRSLLRLKLIMDEWRLREGTAAELALPIGSEGGGHLRVPPAKILLIEDDHREAELITNCCAHENYQLTIEPTIAAALENSKNGDHDVVTHCQSSCWPTCSRWNGSPKGLIWGLMIIWCGRLNPASSAPAHAA